MSRGSRKKRGGRTPQDTAARHQPEPSPRRLSGVLWGVLIVAVALIARGVYLYESSANPTFAAPIMDSADYDDLARALLERRQAHTPLFWQPVFYPLYLAAVYLLTNSSIWAAKLIQVALGAATCLLTYRLGDRIFGRSTGILAGLFVALYGPLIFFEAELLATGWAALWAVGLTLLFIRTAETNRLLPALALGIVGALSVITRPTFLPVFVAGCVWLVWMWRRGDRPVQRIAPKLALAAAGFTLIAVPVAGLNYGLTGHFGIMPASGGINLYIGNNPTATETTTLRPGHAWDALAELPARHGVANDPWARERFFYRQATYYNISSHPGAFLGGLAHKSLEFVSSREIPRSLDVYVFRAWSYTLSALAWKVGGFGFPFGILLPLAAVGAVWHWRKLPGPIWLALTLYPLAILLVFVAARYRMPLVPIIAILAAAGGVAIGGALRVRDWRRLGLSGGVTAAMLLLSTLPGPFPAERINYRAELHQFLGNRLFQEHKLVEAVQQYKVALAFAPEDADVHGKLAEALLEVGLPDEAITHYEASLRTRPDSAANAAALGVVLLQQGEVERAIAAYQQAVRIDPEFGKAYSNLGVALQQSGRLDDAIAAYRAAARLDPNEATIQYNLGVALAQRGDAQGAIDALHRSLEINPGNIDLRCELALTFFRNGQRSEALKELHAALRIDPDHQRAQSLLMHIQRNRAPSP